MKRPKKNIKDKRYQQKLKWNMQLRIYLLISFNFEVFDTDKRTTRFALLTEAIFILSLPSFLYLDEEKILSTWLSVFFTRKQIYLLIRTALILKRRLLRKCF